LEHDKTVCIRVLLGLFFLVESEKYLSRYKTKEKMSRKRSWAASVAGNTRNPYPTFPNPTLTNARPAISGFLSSDS
jgi:hypothetical protein